MENDITTIQLLQWTDLCITWAKSLCPKRDLTDEEFVEGGFSPAVVEDFYSRTAEDEEASVYDGLPLCQSEAYDNFFGPMLKELGRPGLGFSLLNVSWWGLFHRLFLLRGLCEWFMDQFGESRCPSWGETLDFWFHMVPDKDLVPVTKHVLVCPMAWCLRNQRPPWPLRGVQETLFPFTGPLGKWVRMKYHGRTFNDSRSCYSLLMVKKACFQVPKSFIGMTMSKHARALSRHAPTLEESAKVSDISKERVKRLTYCLRRFWLGIDLRPLESEGGLNIYEPSSGAAYEATRRLGGQQSRISRLLETDGKYYSTHSRTGDLISMVEILPGKVRQVYGPPVQPRKLLLKAMDSYGSELGHSDVLISTHRGKVAAIRRGPYRGGLVGSVPVKTLPAGWFSEDGKTIPWLKGHRGSDMLHCVVEAVIEPLKCRLVTKSESLPYWLVKGWQKALWKHVSLRRACSLVGRPISCYDIADVIELGASFYLYERALGRKLFCQSIDYTSSTDLVNIAFTEVSHMYSIEAARKRHSRVLRDTRFRRMLDRVILNHYIEYPEDYHIAPIVQENGQLMGSPLSFPHLCAINLCTFWAAYEEYFGRTCDRDELPVRVNGDDMFFISSAEFYNLWSHYRDLAGFEPSLGKNYTHEEVAIMNSQLFRVKLNKSYSEAAGVKVVTIREKGYFGGVFRSSIIRSPNGTRRKWSDWPEEVPIPNLSDKTRWVSLGDMPISPGINGEVHWFPTPNWGLLVGQSKVRKARYGEVTLADSYKESVLSGRNPERLHARWLHHNKEDVDVATCSGLWNLFIQPEYGGLGLIPFSPNCVYATPFQLHVASYLKSLISGTKALRPLIQKYNVTPHSAQGFELREDRYGRTWARRVFGPLADGWSEDGDPIVYRPGLAHVLGSSSLEPVTEPGDRIRVPGAILKEVRKNAYKDSIRGLPSVERFMVELHGVVATATHEPDPLR